MRLVFATNNLHKLEEIRHILQNKNVEILSLQEIGCFDEIPETADTLEGNALQKAEFIFEKFGINCFADDTGLQVDALHGAPGVYSARYAGKACSFEDNINKLLIEMKDAENRTACFKTVIALILDGEKYFFSGEVAGEILSERKGNHGFGYDPVFIPKGYDLSFAEMDASTKNGLSHRFHATSKLIQFLLEKTTSK
ncbi:MAG: non-canonical purine NTP diphosphatase [Bacteroidota bacterium]